MSQKVIMMVVVVLEVQVCIVVIPSLDSYSEDEEISVGDSGPSSSPTYMLTGYLSGYCPKENDKRFWSKKTVLL